MQVKRHCFISQSPIQDRNLGLGIVTRFLCTQVREPAGKGEEYKVRKGYPSIPKVITKAFSDNLKGQELQAVLGSTV